ncbi:transcriptional regulator [Thiotrichales bacterium 19S3-7]|nr:transcriptional regulator [Thiotrichales bacterium 19S3-7]MCF6802602.1 transcriptional regulator [Thiotrichales bacterium 19S3-11]
MSKTIKNALKHWQYITPLVSMPVNDKEYEKLVKYQDELLELCAENETHSAWGLVNLISNIIEQYDAKNYSLAEHSGIDALIYLMNEHGLKQVDLSGLGSQGVVSEILNGKRQLNVKQIQWLCKRFHVSPNTFIDLDNEEVAARMNKVAYS